MRAESPRCGAIRTLLQVDAMDEEWWSIVAEVLTLKYPEVPSQADMRHLWLANMADWGQVKEGVLIGSPRNPSALECTIWQRPDGAPELIEAAVWPEAATRMVRLALYASLMLELRKCGLVSYVRKHVPAEWRRCKTYHRGDELQHVVWADALLLRAAVWNRRGTFQEPGELPVLVLQGSIVIELGDTDLGFF